MPRRTWSELAVLYADNITGAITAARLRDGFASVAPHVATEPPGVTDDSGSGFDVGHAWVDTSASPPDLYVCVDATEGAAVWAAGGGGGGGADGEDGADGREIELRNSGTHIQWRYMGEAEWADLVALADITGPAGVDGADGAPGADGIGVPDPSGEADGRMLATASGALVYVDAPSGSGGSGIAPADGLLIVKHGAVASTTRPTAASVYWQGSVAPTNRALGDLWLETSAYD